MKKSPALRARIDRAVARAAVAVMVKRASTAAGLTQAELAARARTTQAVIARIEGGKTFTPSLDLLDRITRALGGRVLVQSWVRVPDGSYFKFLPGGHRSGT